MVEKTTLTLRGTAEVKEDISGQATAEGVIASEGTSFTEQDIKFEVKIEDPERFHRLMCKRSAAEIAVACLPEEYNVERELYDGWGITCDLNAVEATEWAQEVANNSEDNNIFDVLTLWLQTLGSMRVRRALHTELQAEGVDMSHVG